MTDKIGAYRDFYIVISFQIETAAANTINRDFPYTIVETQRLISV